VKPAEEIEMTTLIYHGKVAKMRARIGDTITKRQAQRALKSLGGSGFWFVDDNCVQIYKQHGGPWKLRRMTADTEATR
jgi:hypothetical protein